MTDLSMCGDPACPSRSHCRRHEASGTRPNPDWQAYADFHCPRGLLRCAAYLPTPDAPPADRLTAPRENE